MNTNELLGVKINRSNSIKNNEIQSRASIKIIDESKPTERESGRKSVVDMSVGELINKVQNSSNSSYK
jgi:hypothetical protein